MRDVPRARLLVAAAAALGLTLVASASAASIPSDVDANWSGYVVQAPADQTTGVPGTFATVSGTWVQPKANCSTAPAGASTSSAFWVGLGGDLPSSQGLEQVGTEVDCTALGQAKYVAWYELVPALSKGIKLVVSAGDRINGSVSVAGRQVTVTLRNLTRGTSFSKVLPMASPDTTSAEWIAEAPSACDSTVARCRQVSLTNFGTVRFSQASATDSTGHIGAITDPTWSPTALTLQSDINGQGFGRFRSMFTPDVASPGGLTAAGTAFTVKWSTETTSSSNDAGGYGSYGFGGFGG
jgi:hypothetical protein